MANGAQPSVNSARVAPPLGTLEAGESVPDSTSSEKLLCLRCKLLVDHELDLSSRRTGVRSRRGGQLMNRGIIGTIIGVLVVIILVIVIMQLT